eukprot:2867821-Pyramimonas_sp.AAC.1
MVRLVAPPVSMAGAGGAGGGSLGIAGRGRCVRQLGKSLSTWAYSARPPPELGHCRRMRKNAIG